MEKLSLHSNGKHDHIAQLQTEQQKALQALDNEKGLDAETKEKMKVEIFEKYKKLIKAADNNLY